MILFPIKLASFKLYQRFIAKQTFFISSKLLWEAIIISSRFKGMKLSSESMLLWEMFKIRNVSYKLMSDKENWPIKHTVKP